MRPSGRPDRPGRAEGPPLPSAGASPPGFGLGVEIACRGHDTFFLTKEWEFTAVAFLCNDDRDPSTDDGDSSTVRRESMLYEDEGGRWRSVEVRHRPLSGPAERRENGSSMPSFTYSRTWRCLTSVGGLPSQGRCSAPPVRPRLRRSSRSAPPGTEAVRCSGVHSRRRIFSGSYGCGFELGVVLHPVVRMLG
jgi:hypothetical protein